MRIPEELVRQRSYEIWLREGRPSGLADKHWFQAIAELDKELGLSSGPSSTREKVPPRLPISHPPHRISSRRIGVKSPA